LTTESFCSVVNRRRRATPVITSTFENVSDTGVCLAPPVSGQNGVQFMVGASIVICDHSKLSGSNQPPAHGSPHHSEGEAGTPLTDRSLPPGISRRDLTKTNMAPPRGWAPRGQRLKGKKRHILVDTQGLLMHAIVHAADIQDRDGGAFVMATMFGLYPFLMKLYADGAIKARCFAAPWQK
jgi:hypothetical protein